MYNIIITGCTRGIGLDVARKFLSDDKYKVFGISRNKDVLKDLQEQYGTKKFQFKTFDLSEITPESPDLVNEVAKFMPHIDIIINNSGLLINKHFESFTKDDIDLMFRINSIAPGILVQSLLKLLGQSSPTHVVNISSMGGFQGASKYNGLSWYSASKAALAVLTECLANEYQHKKIYFNCLALGAVQTEMLSAAFPEYKAPLSATEMADFVKWFSTEGYKYFNGKILPVALSNP